MTVGWVTLDVGEQALVYAHDGTARIEHGPARLFLFRERLTHLARYSANQNEYLVICHYSGEIQHMKGPCVEFGNPLHHKCIDKKTMISLDANEVLVVYKNDEKKGVTRYIQYGPTTFMPGANEWFHEFCWHGADPQNKTHVIPAQQKFTKLQIIPQQLYYNVDEVRMADDAVIKVKLMLFYELTDIELMLNATKDPVADFINCVCADVVAFASKYTYIEFMEKAEDLNDMDRYPRLMERCKQIGYDVTKVVFRGYFAHEKLQGLHDKAITARSQLKIEYEREQQQQLVIDMKMNNEQTRLIVEQKMELNSVHHKQELEKAQTQHQLQIALKQEMEKLKQEEQNAQAELQGRKAKDEQQLQYHKQLQSLGVDLNSYLQTQNPVPDKVVRIVADQSAANLHLHHS